MFHGYLLAERLMGQLKTGETRRFEAKANLIFVLCILAAALVAFLWLHNQSAAPGLKAVLVYGEAPGQTRELPLNKNATYDIDTGLYTVHIKVEDGTAAFVNSPCPDHTCEGFGRLGKEGEWAACLPAKAMLTIEAAG